MQLQEIYNKVKTHLLKQKSRSCITWSHGLNCAYKSKDGLQCAIGVLITPEAYALYPLEHKSLLNSAVKRALSLSGVPVDNPEVQQLLTDLSFVHDNRQPEHWEFDLEKVRLKHNLNEE